MYSIKMDPFNTIKHLPPKKKKSTPDQNKLTSAMVPLKSKTSPKKNSPPKILPLNTKQIVGLKTPLARNKNRLNPRPPKIKKLPLPANSPTKKPKITSTKTPFRLK
jgi:hypothetical protein